MREHGVTVPLYIPGVNCRVNKRGELLRACLVTLLPDKNLHALPIPINARYITTLSFERTRFLQRATSFGMCT